MLEEIRHRLEPRLPPRLSRYLPIPKLQINLKQWRILLAVVHHGSFASAANHLNISQPAISYTIAKMEEQLGMSLLRLEGRKACLTESGRVLLSRANRLLQEAAALEDLAETIRVSARPKVCIGIEQGFPLETVLPLLRSFSLREQHVGVQVMELPRADVKEGLLSHALELAITAQVPDTMFGELLLQTEYIAAAHPDHPLFRLGRELSKSDLDREVQVVPEHEWDVETDRTDGDSPSLRWRVKSLQTAESAVMEGLGFAWLPLSWVDKAMRSGRLAPLPLTQESVRKATYYLVEAVPDAYEANALSAALRSIAS